jgi:hypothetical protein
MAFDLLSFLGGIAGGILLAIIIKIIGKIRNRTPASFPSEKPEYQPHPNPPFDNYRQEGVIPKPIFETDERGETIKRFIRG